MDEASFIDGYDPAAYDRPSVAVDLVLMSVVERQPAVLLMRRDAPPHNGRWALPGGFVGIDEGLDAAARRILAEKAHVADPQVEQLYTFGAPGRDPRMRVISVAYFALLPEDRIAPAVEGTDDRILARLSVPEAGAPVATHAAGGDVLPLAFDHGEILRIAVARLRGRLDWSPIAFALLPERFTLRALQDMHEAILGRPLNKPAFRRRMIDRGWMEATGERETGTSFRPPELYRYIGG